MIRKWIAVSFLVMIMGLVFSFNEFYLLSLTGGEIFTLIRLAVLIITVLLFTLIIHSFDPLEKLVDRIFPQEEELLVEHLIYYVGAYIIWAIIDFGYFNRPFILIFLFEKIYILLFTLPLIYFYSEFYRYLTEGGISRWFDLAIDVTGFVLALSVGAVLEQFLINARPSLVTTIFHIMIGNFVIIIFLMLSMMTYWHNSKRRKIKLKA